MSILSEYGVGAIIPWFGECAYTTLQSTAILCIACLCSARSHNNLIQSSSFFNKKALSDPKSRHYAALHNNSYQKYIYAGNYEVYVVIIE